MVHYLNINSEDHASKAHLQCALAGAQDQKDPEVPEEHPAHQRHLQGGEGADEGAPLTQALKLFTILEHFFTVLFLCDHRIFLGELEVISKGQAVIAV